MTSSPHGKSLETTSCDREPIHIPGSIQPHGVLIAFDSETMQVTHVSENAPAYLGASLDQILGNRIDDACLGPNIVSLLKVTEEQALADQPRFLASCSWTISDAEHRFDVLGHRNGKTLIFDLEETATDHEVTFRNLHPHIHPFVSRMESMQSEEELCRFTASEVRSITSFDRVMVYRFDEHWNGLVVAEDRNENLPSYLDLRFPASDIPQQARQLYSINRVRIIPDANYSLVPLVAFDKQQSPLDLSFSTLRSVSPVHVQYMKNMETSSSMSISILRGNQLWGLIACHHRSPKRVSFEVRAVCDYLSQILSLKMASRQQVQEADIRIRLKSTLADLVREMSRQDNFIDGLRESSRLMMEYMSADGVAIVMDGSCQLFGNTPTEEQTLELAGWLGANKKEDVYSTDILSSEFQPALAYVDVASGIVAVSISKIHQSYLMWFRPELIQSVKWAGDPRKSLDRTSPGATQLHPRKSFELYRESIRQAANPWNASEIDAAADLRGAIVGIVLRKAEELAELNAELQRSNSELEAFSYSVSHDLRAPFRHIVGYSELLLEQAQESLSADHQRYLRNILEAANQAGALVDDLLSYSRVGRTQLAFQRVDLNQLFSEARRELEREISDDGINWQMDNLPVIQGDVMMLRLVAENLLSNAVKFTRESRPPKIIVGVKDSPKEWIFCVQDNGVGFDMAYVDKLFGVFQRLHRMEDYEGTGIGLANVRRVVARHGGRTWAEGALGAGAKIYFTLPKDSAT